MFVDNREKIRQVAANTGVYADAMLHELSYGDFGYEDLVWFEEQIDRQSLKLKALLRDFEVNELGIDIPSSEGVDV
jgi:hypothetical protein